MEHPRRRTRRRAACAIALVVAVGGLAGCTNIGPVTGAPEDPVGPFPDDYERIVRAWIDESFLFISSVEGFRVRRPTPGFARSLFRAPRYGWWTEVSFRPRDMLGASKGRQSYAVLIHNGAVIAHQKRL